MDKKDINNYHQFDIIQLYREKYHGNYSYLSFDLCMIDLIIAFEMNPIRYTFVFAIIIKSLNN